MQFTQTKWIREYFTFSRKEKRAVIILTIAAVLFSLLPSMFPFLVKDEFSLVVDTATEMQLSQLTKYAPRNNFKGDEQVAEEQDRQPKRVMSNERTAEQTNFEVFYFNPNTATADEWKKLGLKEKTIQTILHFRAKGGKFFKAADLGKIYGLHETERERLIPYVQIESKQSVTQPMPVTASTKFSASSKNVQHIKIDINTADTSAWKQLNGIGTKLSQRIVQFRNRLGGFSSIEQVAETYGLPDSVFQKIKPFLFNSNSSIKKINLNKASLDELKLHPYIRYAIANAILQYRNEHGHFQSVGEIKQLAVIDEQLYHKLEPYLEVE